MNETKATTTIKKNTQETAIIVKHKKIELKDRKIWLKELAKS